VVVVTYLGRLEAVQPQHGQEACRQRHTVGTNVKMFVLVG
jgi:hypothetical protein